MSADTLDLLDTIGGWLATIAAIWFLARSFRIEDEDPPVILIAKGITTALLLYLIARFGEAIRTEQNPFKLIPILLCAMGLVCIWRKNISEMIAKPFASLYNDGREMEAKPYYSQANARRLQNKTGEAMTLIREQLEKFPNDFEGQMLLASILAQDMNDLSGAARILEDLLAQAGHEPHHIAHALTTLSEWHMQYSQDPVTARATLERIPQLFPDSELAVAAHQRLAHMETREELTKRLDKTAIEMPEFERDLGLRGLTPNVQTKEETPEQMAARFVRRLEAHPLDWEARERLAVLYANYYQRMNLAVDQLEQLLAAPNQPQKQIVHWLTMLADLHMEHGPDVAAARAALQRIVDLFPKTAAAFRAERGMATLTVDQKATKVEKRTSQDWDPGSIDKYLAALNAQRPD